MSRTEGGSGTDFVDVIDAVGGVLRRHPFMCLAIASEATLVLVSAGWLPGAFAMVLGLPAYAVRALSGFAFGPSYLPALAGLLGIAGLLDMAWRGLLRVADPGPARDHGLNSERR